MKLFVLSGDEGNDSVESYSKGETSVVYSNKEHLHIAKTLPEYDRSGIYLLASADNQVYVGETSNFGRRLDQHSNDNKEKWGMARAVVFFSRVRPLDKTELEYIEAVLIQSLKTLGYATFNKNNGKASDLAKYNIHPAQRYEAEKFIEDIKYLSARIVKPEGNFFDPAGTKKTIVDTEDTHEEGVLGAGAADVEKDPRKKIDRKKRKIAISDNEGRRTAESSARQTFLAYVRELSKDSNHLHSMRQMAAGSGARVFSLTDKTPSNDNWVKVSEDLYIYKVFSMKDLEKFVVTLAEGTGLETKMEYLQEG